MAEASGLHLGHLYRWEEQERLGKGSCMWEGMAYVPRAARAARGREMNLKAIMLAFVDWPVE